MKLNINLFILCFSLFIFCSCDSNNEFEEDKNKSIILDLSGELIQSIQNALIQDENNPSNYFCRIDSTTPYGLTYYYILPDSLKGKGLKFIINCKIRDSGKPTGRIVTSLTNSKDSTISWQELYADQYIKETNTWTSVKDTIVVSESVLNNSIKALKVFSFKNFGDGVFDIDNLLIEIKKE